MDDQTLNQTGNVPQMEGLDRMPWHAPEIRKSELRDRTKIAPRGQSSDSDGYTSAVV